MKKYFSPLKTKGIITLITVVILGFLWIMVDQVFIRQSAYRFLFYMLCLTILLYFHYRINNPERIWFFANSTTMFLLVFVVLSSLLTHVLILDDFGSLVLHSILFWISTVIPSYIAGLIYALTAKNKP